jgi:hypothetical protein
MLFYLAFGPMYRLPKSIQDQHLAYGYNMNIKDFCQSLSSSKACEDSENKLDCESQLKDLPQCMQTVDLWLHSFNETCYEQINKLELCIDEQKHCIVELNSLYDCESKLNKPSWIRFQRSPDGKK